MQRSLNIVKRIVIICIVLNTFFLTSCKKDHHKKEHNKKHHAKCKVGPRGPRGDRGPQGQDGPQGPKGIEGLIGPQGPSAPSSIASFGSWYVPATSDVNLTTGDIIPFSLAGTTKGITNASGDFTLPNNGIYRALFAIIASPVNPISPLFDIQLNGVSIPHGELSPPNGLPVTFAASAGDHLAIKLVRSDAVLHTLPGNTSSAWILLQQIQ